MRNLFRIAAVLAAFGVAAGLPNAASAAGHDHEMGGLELFLSLQGVSHDGANAAAERQEDSWGIADLVFSGGLGRWRAMGEYNLGPLEKDLERFQVGYEPVPDTVLWLGRFHQPGSAWNNEFHHGHYLETSITRPAIESWEDEEGLVPQHLVGTLLEVRRPLGAVAGLQLSLGIGLGSVMDAEGLVPVELLKTNHGGHQLSQTLRIAFLPQYLGSSSFGLLLGAHRTPVIDALQAAKLGANEVDQDVLGAYLDLDRDRWRAVAAGYYFGVDLRAPGGERREHFASGYVQLERELPHRLTGYLRHENSVNAGASHYVAIHDDDFVARGNVLGLRWDLARRQAVTVEVSRLTVDRARQGAARIQWSSVIQ